MELYYLKEFLVRRKLLISVLLCCVLFTISTIVYAINREKLNESLKNYSYPPNSGQKTTVSTSARTTTSSGATSTSSATTTQLTMTTPTSTPSEWRLPGNCIPEKYELLLKPDLEKGTYEGTVEIHFNITENLFIIQLNSQGLEFGIRQVWFEGSSGNVPNAIYFKPEKGIVEIVLTQELVVGPHRLQINFHGNLTDRIVGFYRSTYINEDGEERYIATSKLEPTYARQAFPCFDEPDFKAKFSVKILKPTEEGYIALSNMDQMGDPEPVPGTNTSEIVSFNTSVPMSTYLACFIVCDFKYTETTVKGSIGDDVLLRVYATPAQQGKTQFALDVAKNCTAYYIDYFGIEYPLPKLDLIAIPDFVSGAMEHWGLLTFRETALLYDKNISSSSNQQRVATVVAHELAHMWFGNLVTLKWWNDLWLNEGFATYMQFKATDHILPEWGMMDQFLISQLHGVLQFDAGLSSHPIVVTVETPNQITEIFDSISYNKGASILRMLENAVGEDTFEKAITSYLKKYKYSNAVTKNLLDEIQAIEDKFNVVDFMDTWTIQTGYPILDVIKTGDEYTLTQKRFYLNPDHESQAPASPFAYKWTIPVTYITDKNETNKLEWFDKSASEIKIKIEDAKWVKFNQKQIGYYRVNYPKEMWNTLSENIQTMETANRAHLLEESFSIAKVGLLDYDVPLNMTKFLKNEFNYIVWDVAASELGAIRKLLLNTPLLKKFQSYVQSLVEPIQQNLTWIEKEEDKHLTKLARARVTKLACWMGHKTTLDEAAVLFKKWLTQGTQLSQNIKDTVYVFGMINATPEEWDQLFDRYMKESDAQEKSKLMSGLTAIRNPQVLNNLIELAKNESVVRGQDYFSCLQSIAGNPVGTSLVWDYVREHWLELVDRFTLNDRYLGRLIPSITSTFSTKVRKIEMEDFFKRYPDAGAGETARKQALEKVTNNIKWLENYKDQIDKWLNENVN